MLPESVALALVDDDLTGRAALDDRPRQPDAEQHADADKKKRELADVRNNAEGLIYTTEKSLDEYASALQADDLAEIRADLEELKGVLGTDDAARIKESLQRLEGSAYRIADAIYSSHGQDEGGKNP